MGPDPSWNQTWAGTGAGAGAGAHGCTLNRSARARFATGDSDGAMGPDGGSWRARRGVRGNQTWDGAGAWAEGSLLVLLLCSCHVYQAPRAPRAGAAPLAGRDAASRPVARR